MAKGKHNPLWRERVLEWQKSGKNSRSWYQENEIPCTTFCGWRSRFNKVEEKEDLTPCTKSGFIELKEQKDINPGIILECSGVKIHLTAGFNAVMLKRCLDCLRGAPC
jgi:hypothetical protein